MAMEPRREKVSVVRTVGRLKRTGTREVPALGRTYSVAGQPITVWCMGSSGFAREMGGKLHGALEKIFPVHRGKPGESGVNYVIAPSNEVRHGLQKVLLPGEARVRKYSVFETNEKGRRVQFPNVSKVFRDMLTIAGGSGKLLTWGAAGAVKTREGLAGVLVLGPEGSGKTELVAKDMVGLAGFHQSDDVVHLGLRDGVPVLNETGYRALLRYRGSLEGIPKKKLKELFIESFPPHDVGSWRHMPISAIRELFPGEKVVKKFHAPGTMRLDTILFIAPMEYRTEKFDNLRLKREEMEGDAFKKALAVLGGEEWRKLGPKKRAETLSRIFNTHSAISPAESKTLVNWNDPKSVEAAGATEEDAQAVRKFVTEWVRKQAVEEYSVPAAKLDEFDEIVGKARALHVIGKWTPPREARNFAAMLMKAVREAHSGQQEFWFQEKPAS